MTTDPSTLFRQVVENALTHLTWYEEVQSELGLTGISQIWDDEPAWYFWLGGRSYLLRYAGNGADPSSGLTAALHLFPTREEVGEGKFTEEEKALLTPEEFDFATMTPAFDSFAKFEGHFIAGELSLFMEGEGVNLLAASGYESTWAKVWEFTRFIVSTLAFFNKSAPMEGPTLFTPTKGVKTALVPFDAKGAKIAGSMIGGENHLKRKAPKEWQRLAHEEHKCSANGTCACTH